MGRVKMTTRKKKEGRNDEKGIIDSDCDHSCGKPYYVQPSALWAQQKGPIKIGFITPLSGGFVANGKDMLMGFQLYLEEIGYQAAGRKIELLVEDDEAIPATSIMKTRKLVEKDGVHMMAGGLVASTGYALVPYIESKEIPMFYPIMANDDLTQRNISKWIVRTGWSSSQPNHPLADYAYKTLHYRKVSIIAYDFAFGWESVGGFQKAFEDLGGRVLQKIWTPMTAVDFSPYLAQIIEGRRRGVCRVLRSSDDAVRQAISGVWP